MGLSEIVEKVTDPYERKARLWPALIAVFPLIVTIELLYSAQISILSNIAAIGGAFGLIYLLTNLSREFGKRIEPTLFEYFGGKPTTQLLRHRDSTIESVTKARYHNYLSKKIDHPFPTQEQETKNPQVADDIYQSGVRWLLNKTRDTQRFSLLFKENINYGFRRNLVGLKPFGISVSIISMVWVLNIGGIMVFSPAVALNLPVLATLPNGHILSLFVSGLLLLTWVLFVSKSYVKTAAFTYAETLLRVCDDLADE